MKKLILITLIIFIFLSGITVTLAANTLPYYQNKFVLKGYVVSHIPTSDLISKNSNALPGLDKVDNAEDLRSNEYTDNANNVPLFARVNLFSYDVTDKKPWALQDLKNYYKTLTFRDYYGRESVISAINSLYQPNGIPQVYTTKAEPKIEITYKKVSAGKKTSYIAVRNVVKTNSVVTHFLLDPYKKPLNERINRFDFAYAYDINPCFTSTLYERKRSGNDDANFSGFFVDIPSISNLNYFSIVERSLKKFSVFVHSKNKLLIVENLEPGTYELGKYGDIIGIKYADTGNSADALKKIREMYPDKVIFATIDADFAKRDVLVKTLRKLAMFGVYPEFERDTSTGDFFYYEKSFYDNYELINCYTKIIETENGFTFSRQFEYNNFIVSEFVKGNKRIYAVQGKGVFKYPVSSSEKITATDSDGNTIPQVKENGDAYFTAQINGFKAILIKDNGSSDILLLGMIPEVSGRSASFIFKNTGGKSIEFPLIVKSGEKTVYQDRAMFLPLSDHLLVVKSGKGPINISFAGETHTFGVPKTRIPVSLILLFTLFVILVAVYLFVRKRKPIKRLLNVKKFALAVLVIPVLTIVLNRYFVHYSLHTITFLVFALMYVLLALYDTDFQEQSVFAFCSMLFLGFLFNYLEFGTLMPHFFDGVLPFHRYYIMIYTIPFIFAVLFFGMYGNAKINKWEMLVFTLTLVGPAFLYQAFSTPFVTGFEISSFYPVLISLIGGGLLGVFHKRGFAVYLVVFGIFATIVAFGLFSSVNYYNLIILNPANARPMLIMKDILLFSLPLFFILLFHHNIAKESPSISLNTAFSVILSLVIFAAYFSQWSVKLHGSDAAERLFAVPLYIAVVFLMSIVMFEPINKKKSV